MKIFVAIPTRDSKLEIDCARCLLDEQIHAILSGDEIMTTFQTGTGSPVAGRNQLVKLFLESEADRLVFVDSDISWTPGDLVKVARHKADVVGGAYRFKMDEEIYPVTFQANTELWTNAQGLMEVETLPTGFLAISKSVFYKFKETHPKRTYTHFGKTGFAFFHAPWREGHLYTEDTNFCIEWREMGGKVWLDPELTLTHHDGPKAYTGHIGNWLKSRIK